MEGLGMKSLSATGQVRKYTSRLPIPFVVSAVLIASLIGVGFVMAPHSAYACSCVQNPPPQEAMDRSAVVFAGRVVSLNLHERPGDVWSGADPVTVEFDVNRVWKGYDYQTMYLTTARSGATCGFTFVEGEEYLVYSSDATTVSLCSRTRSKSEAKEDLAALGEGRFPASGAVGPTPTVSDLPEIPAPVRPEERERTSDEPGSGSMGVGCGPGSQAADMSFVALLVGAVWLGLRRKQS